eukprot:s165_g7.t1
MADKLTTIARLPAGHKVRRQAPLPPWLTDVLDQAAAEGRPWFHIYLDNFCAMQRCSAGEGAEAGYAMHCQLEEAWSKMGVLSSAKKRVSDASSVQELGAFIEGHAGTIGPSGDRLLRLVQTTLVCLASPTLKKKWIQVVAGRWVHCMSFRRLAMVCLDATWNFVAGKSWSTFLEAKVRSELLGCCCLGLLIHGNLSAGLSEVTTASDASSSGGAVGQSVELTSSGSQFAAADRKGLSGGLVAPIMVISLFNGVRCTFRSYDLVGVTPLVCVSYEIDAAANRKTARRWPNVQIHKDVRTLTADVIRGWRCMYPQLEEIHIWGGFPCVGLSSVRANRLNLQDRQSALFWEFVRVVKTVRQVFGYSFRVLFAAENVASMDAAAEAEITEALAVKPWKLDPTGAVPIHRPRFCWTNTELVPMEGAVIEEKSRWFDVGITSKYPLLSQWLEEEHNFWPGQATQQQRRQARQNVVLEDVGLTPATLERYYVAVSRLQPVLEEVNNEYELDEFIAEWVQSEFEDDTPLHLVGDALSGLHHFEPFTKRCLPKAWRLYGIWRKYEVPRPRAVPHSLRGMALGQLQHLEALFVKTGWLVAQCEAFNTDNADALANGTKFRQNPNLYALDTFVVTPMSKPGICTARENDKLRTIAEANRKSSFSELVNPFGLLVHCFVSHFWGHDFGSTVTALELWAEANYQRMTSEKQSLVYWICLFALNQHNVAEEVGENPRHGPFNAALAQASAGAVMVLDEEIRPFSRIWCLFEISRLKDLQQPFELICSEGSLSQPERFGNQAVSTEMLKATCEALWNVSAAKAQSSVESDQHQIWAEIADQHTRIAIDGLGVQRYFEIWSAIPQKERTCKDFDRYLKSLLSTTVLKLLLGKGQHASAAKCCLYGADVSSEQLTEICNSFARETERKDWQNSFLIEASRASRASTVQLLLENGADAGAARKDGVTALMAAAEGAADNDGETALMIAATVGHEAVAELLLTHGADARAANNEGTTALGRAATVGHEAVAELLLTHGADARAANNEGTTALGRAAVFGHVAVSELLLAHGADAGAATNDGCTALMCAAASGHVAVAKLLLEHGADAGAATNDGFTALMAAAEGGHEAVAELLFEHGADAGAAKNDGATALMCAATGGHVAAAELLLTHGVDAGAADNDGETALMRAATVGHEAVAELLLTHGADAGAAKNDGGTALMCAATVGHEAVAELLLTHGADARATGNDGATALMCAATNNEGTTAVFHAATRGHEAVAALLLTHGADARAADNDGVTALMRAAAGGHAAVAQLLLEHGADAGAAENEGVTALMCAAAGGHVAAAELLLTHGADARAAMNDDDGATALMAAAAGGHVAVAELLLTHGADAGAADNKGSTPLISAAIDGHEAVAELLLTHGADVGAPDNDCITALMRAAAGGHAAVAQLLLEHGADAEAANNEGATALMFAAAGGHVAAAELLLTHGADAQQRRNNGVTALMLAATGGHEAVAELLLTHGADAGAAANDGTTALMAAATGGHVAVAELLLTHGVDAGAAANDGATALMCAATGGHEAVFELLLTHGGLALLWPIFCLSGLSEEPKLDHGQVVAASLISCQSFAAAWTDSRFMLSRTP